MGRLIFPDNPEMQLGLFFTGISPGGGASNIWTAIFEGNLTLSLIMSAIGNICACFMMPLWLFILGRLIFQSAQLEAPYTQLCSYIIGLIVPLSIGYLIKRYLKKTSEVLIKMSKYIMAFVLVFIICFAIITNLYLFEIFSWQVRALYTYFLEKLIIFILDCYSRSFTTLDWFSFWLRAFETLRTTTRRLYSCYTRSGNS